MKKASYMPYNIESYGLVYNNEVVAELNVGEDGAIEIVQKVNEFLSEHDTDKPDCNVVIQNDSDFPYLGVIVDIYYGDEWHDCSHFMFDDFIDE